eukprot:1809880-Pleurochrysis_carterae.AAC.1
MCARTCMRACERAVSVCVSVCVSACVVEADARVEARARLRSWAPPDTRRSRRWGTSWRPPGDSGTVRAQVWRVQVDALVPLLFPPHPPPAAINPSPSPPTPSPPSPPSPSPPEPKKRRARNVAGSSRGAQGPQPDLDVVVREWRDLLAASDGHVGDHLLRALGQQVIIHLPCRCRQSSVRDWGETGRERMRAKRGALRHEDPAQAHQNDEKIRYRPPQPAHFFPIQPAHASVQVPP